MSKSLLIIGLVWPEPRSSAAGWRMLQIIDLFIREGFQITFASAASKSPYSFPLTGKGIVEKQIRLNDSSFDKFVEELKPDIVLFDRFIIEEQFSWRVAKVCPQAIRILDTEDLHFVRNARQQAYKRKVPFEDKILYNDLSKRELASIYRSDLSIIISLYEINLLEETFRIDSKILNYLPFNIQKTEEIDPCFTQRSNFMFIGNFLHEPNWSTVQVLKEIWPGIRKKLPQTEIHIYGAYPSDKVFQLNNSKQGFIIKGRADDAIETLKKYRVLLAPIPFGAGQKGKFIDALIAGTPSITTSIGAQGMLKDLDWPGYITETSVDLIDKAVLLHESQESWEIAKTKSESAMSSLIDENWGVNFFEKLRKIESNLEQHRSLNVVGQILWSNQFLSTKYLSQWIEEKNKKAQT